MVKLSPKLVQELDELDAAVVAAGKRVEDFQYGEEELKTLTEAQPLHRFGMRRGLKSERLQGALVEASRKANVQIDSATKIADNIGRAMSKEDATDFNTLVTMGRKYQVEFDDDKLAGWDIPDSVKKGYKEYIKASQEQYLSANALDHKIKSSQGWKTNKVGDTAKEFNSGQLSTPKFSQMSILDPDSGDIFTYRNSSVDDIKEKYLQKGYKLYTLHPDEVISRDMGYTHYLSKAEDELGELTKYTLPYVKGGSNGYTPNTHFVKIGRDFYDKEGGTIFHGFTKTLVADENVKRLEQYAKEVNEVSDMWNRSQGDLAALQRELNDANFTEFKINSATDVKDLMRTKENPNGLIDPKYKAEVLRNNEKYVYPDKSFGLEQSEDFDQAMSDLMQIRGTYYRSRGDEILSNLNNDYGHVVDPFTMWQRNIEQAAQNNTLGRLMADYGEWFKETFKDVIDTKGGKYNINRMSGSEVIASADIKAPNSSYDNLARAARRAQTTYANILNIPTTLDVKIHEFTSDLLHMLPKRWWDNKYMDWALTHSPANFANAVVYRNYLGCFNAKQFLLQGPFQMMNTLAISPVHGTQAAVSLPAIIMGHFFKDTPVVKYIPKLLAGLGGITPQQYEGFMKFIEDYGTFKQFSKRPELAQQMESWLKTWPQIDLIFAQAGNNLAQLHADLTAFLIDGGKNMRNICRLSDDMMLNLNRVNTSTVQRTSIGRIAAQFTSYPLAAYEIMTGHHLKPWQRARFIAMQLGMWGIGGTFARDYVTNMYNFAEEYLPSVDPEELSYALEGIGTKFFAELGIDINEGVDMLGMFNQLSSLVPIMSEIFGSAPELPISNVPTIIVDNYNWVKDLISPNTNTFDLLSWADKTSRMKGTASGVKNIARSLYAYDARQFIDRHGNVLRSNPEQMQIWGSILGFGPIEAKLDYRAVQKENMIREGVRQEFEKQGGVLEAIQEFVTFRDTGHGDKELVQSRAPQWGYVLGNVEGRVREFKAWIREFHPEMENYATSLITKAFRAGEDKRFNRSKAQQQYYEQDINRLTTQE